MHRVCLAVCVTNHCMLCALSFNSVTFTFASARWRLCARLRLLVRAQVNWLSGDIIIAFLASLHPLSQRFLSLFSPLAHYLLWLAQLESLREPLVTQIRQPPALNHERKRKRECGSETSRKREKRHLLLQLFRCFFMRAHSAQWIEFRTEIEATAALQQDIHTNTHINQCS